MTPQEKDPGNHSEQPGQTGVLPALVPWVRAILGLAVGVGLALVVFFGIVRVPNYTPLSDVLPVVQRGPLVPFAMFAMSVCGVVVWYMSKKERVQPDTAFGVSIVALTVAFCALYVTKTIATRQIPTIYGPEFVLIGFGDRIGRCPCSPADSDRECIEGIGLESAEKCWGEQAIARGGLILGGSYLLTLVAFGATVGALVTVAGKRSYRRGSSGSQQGQAS